MLASTRSTSLPWKISQWNTMSQILIHRLFTGLKISVNKILSGVYVYVPGYPEFASGLSMEGKIPVLKSSLRDAILLWLFSSFKEVKLHFLPEGKARRIYFLPATTAVLFLIQWPTDKTVWVH